MGGFRGLSVVFLKLVQHAAAPIATGVLLYLLCMAYGIGFSSHYSTLTLLSMMLVAIFVKNGLPGNQRLSLFSIHVGSIVTGWILVIGVLLLVGYATKTSAIFSRVTVFAWFLLNPVAILLAQWALQELLVHLVESGGNRRRVVIAGVNGVSKHLARNIFSDDRLGMQLLGFFEDRNPTRFGGLEHGELLGKLAELPEYVKTHGIDTIYIALPIGHLRSTNQLLDQLQDTTASVYFVPDISVFDLIQARIDAIHDVPVLALLESPFYGYNGALKRVFDLICATLILLVIWPIMLAIAIGVKLSSPGPVLFKQRRYGLAGNEIVVYKFRTMTVTEDNSEHIEQAKEDDERFTRIGAFLRKHSLDELPQFINVLQGRMSIVGPRPHAVAHNELYRKLVKGYMIRHKVLPGITGWAQVNGCRGETREVSQMENRVQLDLEYLRKWSLGMDIKIILRTAGLVVNDDEAH